VYPVGTFFLLILAKFSCRVRSRAAKEPICWAQVAFSEEAYLPPANEGEVFLEKLLQEAERYLGFLKKET
jgi:hypothetical protein